MSEIPSHYSFFDTRGDVIGPADKLNLAVCPRADEIVVFVKDGGQEERYIVRQVRHVLHFNLDGEPYQIVDILVRGYVD